MNRDYPSDHRLRYRARAVRDDYNLRHPRGPWRARIVPHRDHPKRWRVELVLRAPVD